MVMLMCLFSPAAPAGRPITSAQQPELCTARYVCGSRSSLHDEQSSQTSVSNIIACTLLLRRMAPFRDSDRIKIVVPLQRSFGKAKVLSSSSWLDSGFNPTRLIRDIGQLEAAPRYTVVSEDHVYL